MDLFSLLFSMLDVYLLRIRKLYTYVLNFFLPDFGDNDNDFEANNANKVHL